MAITSAGKSCIRACVLLTLVLFKLAASDALDGESPYSIPESPAPIPYPDDYTNSRFRQDCLKTSPHDCKCTNLWDSPCNCNGRDKVPLENDGNSTSCDCALLCEELWNPHRPLTETMRYKCKIPQVRKYSVKAFIGSKHSESAEVVLFMKRLAEVMGTAIELSVHYVVYLQGDRLGTARGQSELLGDMVGKCAMHLYPEPSVYLPFLACMAMNTSLVPQNFYNCTKLHSVSFSSIRSCVDTQGEALLANDLIASQHYRVEIPTRVYMDDRYFNPGRSNDYLSYEAALCYVFGNTTRPFPWFIFFIMGALILLLGVLFFTIKRWSHTSFIDNLQSLFPWNSNNHDPMDTLLYLRAYGLMDDASDGENDENPSPNAPTGTDATDTSEASPNHSESSARRRRRRRRREEREANNPTSEDGSSSRTRRRRSRRQRRNSTAGDLSAELGEPSGSDLATAPALSQTPAPSAPTSSHQQSHEQGIELETVPDYYYSSDDDDEPGSHAKLLLPRS